MQDFKKKFSFEQRYNEAVRIKKKYPDKIPVIVEKVHGSDVVDIDKRKYLVPGELTVGQFVYVIRRRLNVAPEKAIFLFVNNNILPPTSYLISQLYQEHADKDHFLYCYYCGEATFG